jgi:hypothetical protein
MLVSCRNLAAAYLYASEAITRAKLFLWETKSYRAFSAINLCVANRQIYSNVKKKPCSPNFWVCLECTPIGIVFQANVIQVKYCIKSLLDLRAALQSSFSRHGALDFPGAKMNERRSGVDFALLECTQSTVRAQQLN